MNNRELITTLVAIYGAVIGTLGFLVSLYSFRRDRRRLALVVHPERYNAGDWGNHDCWYLAVSVINTGRRRLALLNLELTYFDTTMTRLTSCALAKPPAFVQTDDGSYRHFMADRHENEIGEGLSARYLFEFKKAEDASPRCVLARDATFQTHHKSIPYSLLRFLVFSLYRAFVFHTPPPKARRPVTRLLLLYEPLKAAESYHLACFASFTFLFLFSFQPLTVAWLIGLTLVFAVATVGFWYLARKYDVEDPLWLEQVLGAPARDGSPQSDETA